MSASDILIDSQDLLNEIDRRSYCSMVVSSAFLAGMRQAVNFEHHSGYLDLFCAD